MDLSEQINAVLPYSLKYNIMLSLMSLSFLNDYDHDIQGFFVLLL